MTESQGRLAASAASAATAPRASTDDEPFGSSYTTPGWQRAQANRAATGRGGQRGGFEARRRLARVLIARRCRGGYSRTARPLTIEGELVAKSTGTSPTSALGDRVFHQKFGNGNVVAVDGNKLTIAFDKAGEKRVVDSFVERA